MYLYTIVLFLESSVNYLNIANIASYICTPMIFAPYAYLGLSML